MTNISTETQTLAKNLKMLLLDVDGVMTDGGIILTGSDLESKKFDVHDGMGITLAKAAGLKVGIVTSRTSDVVTRRARELNMDKVFQGVHYKPEALKYMDKEFQIKPYETAYIGDDIQDLSIMNLVGMPIAVQNAVPSVKMASLYITNACGGKGAIREAVEWLLDLRGELEAACIAVSGSSN